MAAKPKPARVHAADAADMLCIAAADRFAASFIKSAAERFHEEAPDLAAARAIEARLNTEHGQHGRRAGVYAITGRRSTFVPPALQIHNTAGLAIVGLAKLGSFENLWRGRVVTLFAHPTASDQVVSVGVNGAEIVICTEPRLAYSRQLQEGDWSPIR